MNTAELFFKKTHWEPNNVNCIMKSCEWTFLRVFYNAWTFLEYEMSEYYIYIYIYLFMNTFKFFFIFLKFFLNQNLSILSFKMVVYSYNKFVKKLIFFQKKYREKES